MTPLDLLIRSINHTGSTIKLARWLTANSRPVSARTLSEWRARPMRIRFSAIHAMCALVQADLGSIKPAN